MADDYKRGLIQGLRDASQMIMENAKEKFEENDDVEAKKLRELANEIKPRGKEE